MNVVALDAQTHKVILNKSYDTYARGNTAMKKDLKALPKFSLVCIAVKDEASRKLKSNKVIDILAGWGSKEVKKLGFR